jgi:biotin carboxyl carrier protein
MKMESEFKAKVSGTIKQITVKEGDTIDANKILITINPTK